MPKFITYNEQQRRQPLARAGALSSTIKIVDGVLYYWNEETGEWIPVVDEATTSITNVVNQSIQQGGPSDPIRQLYFAGLGYTFR